MEEKNYKVTNKGYEFIYLYEIKKISKCILLISISNLILTLIQTILTII